jgi:energy-coupling factor transporter ATP-binding protein EcfA2
LLDEPTNHLDLDSIEWLENLLIESRTSMVIITHDRSFLDKVATRIVELDRGRLLSYPGNYAAYQQAHVKGWDDDVTSHMIRVGNLYKRLVYAYEFPDNHVYVGLTYDKEDRDKRHRQKEKSAVYQYIKKTGLQPEMKIISDDYIDAEDARNLEGCTIELYKENGWNVLNKAKAGGLGGFCAKKWTKEEVHQIALQYTSPTSFKSKHSSAFNAAKRNGWLLEITKHMTKKKTKWTKDLLIQKMNQYSSPTEFRKYDSDTHQAAFRILGNDFIKDFYKNKIK